MEISLEELDTLFWRNREGGRRLSTNPMYFLGFLILSHASRANKNIEIFDDRGSQIYREILKAGIK